MKLFVLLSLIISLASCEKTAPVAKLSEKEKAEIFDAYESALNNHFSKRQMADRKDATLANGVDYQKAVMDLDVAEKAAKTADAGRALIMGIDYSLKSSNAKTP